MQPYTSIVKGICPKKKKERDLLPSEIVMVVSEDLQQ
jgi:hypothetical protein